MIIFWTIVTIFWTTILHSYLCSYSISFFSLSIAFVSKEEKKMVVLKIVVKISFLYILLILYIINIIRIIIVNVFFFSKKVKLTPSN